MKNSKKGVFVSNVLANFEQQLVKEEKSKATVEKYLRDVKSFLDYFSKRNKPIIEKEDVIEYKQSLIDKEYKDSSVNSMIASMNSFFLFINRKDLKLKSIRIQRNLFCSEEKELTKKEYERLCIAARKRKNERLYLILQTICGTGIRVGELKYITTKAVREGQAVVRLKGKTRTIIIVDSLKSKLVKYVKKNNVPEGEVFLTKHGHSMNRSYIWREMKSICKEARVNPNKVFPHNLRHLFAKTFYAIEKDIAKLADILGHSSIETTRIYIVTSGIEHRKYMQNMQLVI